MVITLQYMHLSRLFIYIKQYFVSIISIKLGEKKKKNLREKDLKTLSLKCKHHKSRVLVSQSLESVEAQL